jgi:hypothetical protein
MRHGKTSNRHGKAWAEVKTAFFNATSRFNEPGNLGRKGPGRQTRKERNDGRGKENSMTPNSFLVKGQRDRRLAAG